MGAGAGEAAPGTDDVSDSGAAAIGKQVCRGEKGGVTHRGTTATETPRKLYLVAPAVFDDWSLSVKTQGTWGVAVSTAL